MPEYTGFAKCQSFVLFCFSVSWGINKLILPGKCILIISFSSLQVVYDANTLYIFAPSAQSRDQWVRNLKEGNGNCLCLTSGVCRYLYLSFPSRMELTRCCGLDLWPKQCWKHTGVLVLAEQCLHMVEALLFSPSAPAGSRLGVGKSLGGDRAGTGDVGWPKGYSRLYNVMFSNKNCSRERKGLGFFGFHVGRCWLGIDLLVGDGEQLPLHHFRRVFLFVMVIKLSLSQAPNFFLSLCLFSPCPSGWGEWASGCVGA